MHFIYFIGQFQQVKPLCVKCHSLFVLLKASAVKGWQGIWLSFEEPYVGHNDNDERQFTIRKLQCSNIIKTLKMHAIQKITVSAEYQDL